MKIRVSMTGTYMVVDMNEEQAHKTFRKMVELLCLTERSSLDSTRQILDKPDLELDKPAMPEPLKKEDAESLDSGVEEPKIPSFSIGYGGFLYIKCPECGAIKGFCAKTRLSNFRCDCGSVTKLENMVPLYMNCECGRNSRYLTNIEEPAFDITCYDCGNPVAVSWNSNKKQYETIR